MAGIKEWHVCVNGETVGPLMTETVLTLLSQGRLGYADYAWSMGQTQWMRISNLPEFESHLPPYPDVPLPGERNIEKPKASATQEPIPSPSRLRRFARVPIEGTALIEDHGEYALENIGLNGAFILSEDRIPKGTSLKMTIQSPSFEGRLEITSKVAWVGEKNDQKSEAQGFAVEFTGMNPVHYMMLQTYVKAMLASAPPKNGDAP